MTKKLGKYVKDKMSNFIKSDGDKNKKQKRKDFIKNIFQLYSDIKKFDIQVKDLEFDETKRKKIFGESSNDKNISIIKARNKNSKKFDSKSTDFDVDMNDLGNSIGFFSELEIDQELIIKLGKNKMMKIIKNDENNYNIQFKNKSKFLKNGKKHHETNMNAKENDQIIFDDVTVTFGSVVITKDNFDISDKTIEELNQLKSDEDTLYLDLDGNEVFNKCQTGKNPPDCDQTLNEMTSEDILNYTKSTELSKNTNNKYNYGLTVKKSFYEKYLSGYELKKSKNQKDYIVIKVDELLKLQK